MTDESVGNLVSFVLGVGMIVGYQFLGNTCAEIQRGAGFASTSDRLCQRLVLLVGVIFLLSSVFDALGIIHSKPSTSFAPKSTGAPS